MPNRCRSRAGFTLFEMLVAIVLIGVVSTLAIPKLAAKVHRPAHASASGARASQPAPDVGY